MYWDFISSLMNVQEYVAGIRGTDLSAITAADLDRKVLAARGSDAVLKMILVDDFFHADPHPGKFVSRMGSRSLFRRPHSWTPANPEHVALSPAM